MISATDFITCGVERGFDFYAGVPCSFLTPLINRAINSRALQYVGATSEGEAIAVAAGAWLAGRRTVVVCQNSGLCDAANPLTSLNHPFRIPTLLVTTWRGQPGIGDEPQHELMGRITPGLLSILEVDHRPFPSEDKDLAAAFDDAEAAMVNLSSFAFLMTRDSVRPEPIATRPIAAAQRGDRRDFRGGGEPPARSAVLQAFLAAVPDSGAIVSTTGMTSRELFTLQDRPQHFYLVGSMGCAAGLALGVAMNASRPVFALDGDGAALMKLGTIATIGACQPPNLVHIILDNGVHDSTGGQPTVAAGVDFAAVALACGYRRATACDSRRGFDEALAWAVAGPGPALIHAKIRPGSIQPLGRPTLAPWAVAHRFSQFLRDDSPAD